MIRLLAVALLAAALPAATAQKAGPRRAAIVDAERQFDGAINRIGAEEQMEVLSATQGVYLGGVGTVFTAEVNLTMVPTLALSPFRPTLSERDKESMHSRKVKRLPLLRQQMRESLARMAATLESMPPNERVVLAVSLFYAKWEITVGLPAQIVMQASRESLLRTPVSESAIQTDEF